MTKPLALPQAKAHWKHKLRKIANDDLFGASVRGMDWSADAFGNPTLTLGNPPRFRYVFLNSESGIATQLTALS
jgi:hypothetical protein